ncbi:MAG: Vms1/Ankzf1 family peptidyl-tRNA hydrolase [Halobacteriaceae archaeon]
MLDQLLGRAALKERIAELEEERERLQARLDAESERRADAVTARDEAERRVNRMEDRVAELEDRVERAESGDTGPTPRGVESVRGDRLRTVLDRIESVEAGPEGALTAMVADGSDLPGAVRSAFGERAALVADAAPCLAVADDAGLVSAALSVPDPPDPFADWAEGFCVDRSWFLPTGRHAVALVRADLFALAEFEGSERQSIEGFTSDVKGDHSKGGFSQRRFERLRDEQIAEHVERCREAIEARAADRLYVLGDARLVSEFDADATAAVDATGDPEAALADAVRDFWTVRLTLV